MNRRSSRPRAAKMGLSIFVAAALAACAGGSSTQSGTEGGQSPTAAEAPAPAPTTAKDVVKALKASGLPIEMTVVFTAKTDPNDLLGRPGGYESKASFSDDRVDTSTIVADDVGSVEFGGTVEYYDSSAGARKRAEYIQGILVNAPILGAEYDYVADTVLLRVSAGLTPKQASEYQEALGEIMAQTAELVEVSPSAAESS